MPVLSLDEDRKKKKRALGIYNAPEEGLQKSLGVQQKDRLEEATPGSLSAQDRVQGMKKKQKKKLNIGVYS